MKSQRSNIERNKLKKVGIKMEIDEIIKQNKRKTIYKNYTLWV